MKPLANLRSGRSPRRSCYFGLVAAVALGATAMVSLAGLPAAADESIPAGTNIKSWAENGKNGENLLRVVEGTFPTSGGPIFGVVKTDTNCEPDEAGLSHCSNRIALATGGEIEVVHNHAMMTYECLAPDQKVTLTKLDANWIVAKSAE